jgi:hypothetical protein
MDLAAACCIAGELFWSSGNGDDLGWIKGTYAKRCACSPLATNAMTGNHQLGRPRERKRNRAATASGIAHRKNPTFKLRYTSTGFQPWRHPWPTGLRTGIYPPCPQGFPTVVPPSAKGFPRDLPRSRQPVHRSSTRLSTACEQCPVIPQDRLRRIVAGRAGDAAAGMGTGSAMVEALERPAIIGVSQHRSCREQLVQR